MSYTDLIAAMLKKRDQDIDAASAKEKMQRQGMANMADSLARSKQDAIANSLNESNPMMAYQAGMERANRALSKALEDGDEALYKNTVTEMQALYDGTIKSGIYVPPPSIPPFMGGIWDGTNWLPSLA